MTSLSSGVAHHRLARTSCALQLLLTALAVTLFQVSRGARTTPTAVMAVAVVNAVVVAMWSMRVTRDRTVVMSAVVLLVIIAGLLVWPAWDVLTRTGSWWR